jgi:hypothetical protein
MLVAGAGVIAAAAARVWTPSFSKTLSILRLSVAADETADMPLGQRKAC